MKKGGKDKMERVNVSIRIRPFSEEEKKKRSLYSNRQHRLNK